MSVNVELGQLVDELGLLEGTLVMADKGYVGQRNEAVLEARGLKNRTIKKA